MAHIFCWCYFWYDFPFFSFVCPLRNEVHGVCALTWSHQKIIIMNVDAGLPEKIQTEKPKITRLSRKGVCNQITCRNSGYVSQFISNLSFTRANYSNPSGGTKVSRTQKCQTCKILVCVIIKFQFSINVNGVSCYSDPASKHNKLTFFVCAFMGSSLHKI